MPEVEVKFLDVDAKALIELLKSMGGAPVFEGYIETAYFDFSDKHFRNGGKTIRLRKKGQVAEFTFKEKIPDPRAKCMNELEVRVADYGQMRAILLGMGMEETLQPKKYRRSFALGKARYEFDTFEGLPTFLEIEALDVETVASAAGRIGLSMQDAKAWNSKDVLEYYARLHEDGA